jgi:hypothetical protein
VAKATMAPAGLREERTYIAEGTITRGMAVIPGTAENQVKPPGSVATGNLLVIGIAAENAASGDPVRVVTRGEVTAIAKTAITHGSLLKTVGADGRVEPTTTDNDGVFAQAVSDAAGDTDEVTIRVLGPNRY